MTRLTILALCLVSTSCTIYVKDIIHGDPTVVPVEENYQEALNEGFTTEEAKRRALLFTNGTDETRAIKARRKEKEAKARDKPGRNFFSPLIFWD